MYALFINGPDIFPYTDDIALVIFNLEIFRIHFEGNLQFFKQPCPEMFRHGLMPGHIRNAPAKRQIEIGSFIFHLLLPGVRPHMDNGRYNIIWPSVYPQRMPILEHH